MADVLETASKQGANIWYVPLVGGKGSQSRTVGRGLSIATCWRHGWLERGTANLTDAGREVLNAYREREAKRRERYVRTGTWR